MRILLVEDDRMLAQALQEGLEVDGYSVATAYSGEDGFRMTNTEKFDLVVLDVMLPGRNGFEVLSAIRARAIPIPVLVLTAKDAIEDRVRGLDAGADDYLVKPFAFPELSARVRALLRRGKAEAIHTAQVEDLHMDLISRSVRRGTQVLDLTTKEYEVLEYLVRHQGQIVSREMLARDVWKETARHTPLDNVIDVHIGRIRRKVDEGFATKLIQTVRGIGFVLKAEDP